jgi:Ca2+-binding EF-hand superfamily protein
MKTLGYVNITQDLIEMTIKKLDLDRDGKVSFSDFETTVKASLVVDLGNIPISIGVLGL